MNHARTALASVSLALGFALAAPALALDDAERRQAEQMAERAIEFLRAQQDAETGGWGVFPGERPQFPAITGLVVTGMAMDDEIGADDPAVSRGVEYMLGFAQPDGGIYDRILASYNTAICVSALAQLEGERDEEIGTAISFLRTLQWSEDSANHPETGQVGPEHAFYGGLGYGNSSRPDMSNLNFFLQALEDAGVPGDDPAVQRALTFLQRTQMDDRINDREYAEGSRQGGFIYATSPNGEQIGIGESKAGQIDESLQGRAVSRLRAYGSITYAGFKALIYADLDPDDLRVQAAYDWIRRNYTLAENPGIGDEGRYYYFLMFARALHALGDDTVATIDDLGRPGEVRDWRSDLVEALGALQQPDGSFQPVNDRWMEGDPVLITAYALIALQEALQ